jgi:ferredoxin
MVGKLQYVLRGDAPPWLAKTMGAGSPTSHRTNRRGIARACRAGKRSIAGEERKIGMGYVTGLTRGRQEWTPKFVKAVDDNKCIGCGRCMKICAHGVLAPKEVDEEESAKMFASVKNPRTASAARPAAARATRRRSASSHWSREPHESSQAIARHRVRGRSLRAARCGLRPRGAGRASHCHPQAFGQEIDVLERRRPPLSEGREARPLCGGLATCERSLRAWRQRSGTVPAPVRVIWCPWIDCGARLVTAIRVRSLPACWQRSIAGPPRVPMTMKGMP